LNWQIWAKKVFGRNKGLERFFYGPEGFPKLPRRYKITTTLVVLVLLVYSGILGYSYGFFVGTGTMPFGSEMESVLPPEIQPTVTADQAEQAIENSTLDLAPYGERNNCVELAFIAARQLWWEGYQGTVVKIEFSDGTGHMIVGVPTVDEGWKFLNPQGNVWINPVVGGMFQDKKIVGLYYLYDFVWKPIEGEQK